MSSIELSIDQQKATVCKAVIEKRVLPLLAEHSTLNLGIGSGSTIAHFVQELKASLKVGDVGAKMRCVPTSYQARQLLIDNGLPCYEFDQLISVSKDKVVDGKYLHVTVDGADEVDLTNLDCIKGGGGCHAREKVIANASASFILVADSTKLPSRHGQPLTTLFKRGIPVEVLPFARDLIHSQITAQFPGSTVTVRQATAKCGPCVTDNGNFILDWLPLLEDIDSGFLRAANVWLLCLPGVVDTGLFLGMAQEAFFGCKNGSVQSFTPE